MAVLETKPSWWDRECDVAGRIIRSDVRLAALSVWRNVSHNNPFVVSDAGQAAELMEATVAQISRYLNRKDVGLFTRNIEGLIAHSIRRAIQRELVKRKRFYPLDESAKLRSCGGADESWRTQLQNRLLLQEMIARLSEKSRRVLALRYAGYRWREVSRFMGESVTPLRAAFWRDVARVRREAEKPRKQNAHAMNGNNQFS